jgi:hypothetical protein
VSRVDKPLPLKTLRLASLAVTAATLAMLSSIGYSLALEGQYLSEIFTSENAFVTGGREGEVLGLRLALPLENRGIYPLTIALGADVFVEGKLITRGEPGEIRLLPNERGFLNASVSVPLKQLLEDETIRQNLLTKGVNVTMRLNVEFGLDPLVAMSANIALQQVLGPLEEGLSEAILQGTTDERHPNASKASEFPSMISVRHGSTVDSS